MNILTRRTDDAVCYTNVIARNFFDNINIAKKEFDETGKISSEMIEKIIGKEPVIPDSPDNDARMEAFEEKVAYIRRKNMIEACIKRERTPLEE